MATPETLVPTLSLKNPTPRWRSTLVLAFQTARAGLAALTFLLASLSIVLSQFVFKLVFRSQPSLRAAAMGLTKKYFAVLISGIMYAVCPSRIRVTGDLASLPPGSFQVVQGQLRTALLPKSVVVANHQIYTDWAFLWWIAYTAQLADAVYIVLKASLKRIPVLGYGMANFRFIFLSRKWDTDKQTLDTLLTRLDRAKEDPYCLILFPEGTNMSPSRREVSDKYCAKLGVAPLRNLLLPRATGLRESLRLLRGSTPVVYDVTIGYSGVPQDGYGESIYTMGNVFLKGRAPPITDMYFRAIRLEEIPLGDDEGEAFEKWLFGLWYEKDKLMETYYKKGSFTPELLVSEAAPYARDKTHEVAMAPLKPRSYWEFLQIFAVPGSLFLVGRLFYLGVRRFF